MNDGDPPILGEDDAPELPASDVPAEAPPAEPEPGAPARSGRETRWTIVARQFRKHRGAVWGLRITVVLILIAVYAPVIASAQPLLYKAPGGSLESPWFATLLDSNVWTHALDRLFNIGLIVLTIFLVVRFLLRFVKNPTKRASMRAGWRKFCVPAYVVLALAHVFFGVGETQQTAVEYRSPIDAVKEAEDAVAAVPELDKLRADLGDTVTWGVLDRAVADATRALAGQRSRAAAAFVPPLERARQALDARRADFEFHVQRLGRRYGLPLTPGTEAPDMDPTLPLGLRAGWSILLKTLVEEGRDSVDIHDATKRASVLLSGGDNVGAALRDDLQSLDTGLATFVAETRNALDQGLARMDVPTAEEADQLLAKARAARDEYTIIYPPVPYGYREMLPQGYDRFRRLMDFERGERHLLGTDETGRDVFARLLFGTRISLTIGLVAVSIYVTIGTFFGALAGFFGGKVDLIIMRVVEIIICVPGLFLILTIVALFREKSIFLIMFAIGFVSWTGITRLVRGEFLRERNSEYVLAARSMGYSTPRIIFRHVLPNALSPVLVSATFGVAAAIVIESGLSFLGLGDPSVPSWGGVLQHGRENGYWHLIIPPSIAIFFTVTALNLVGDGVRDALDPKLRD